MSYCRWSCDGFKSDVYAYESSEGYVLHLKGGDTEFYTSLEYFRDALLLAREQGYHVPDHCIESVLEELLE